MNLLFYLNEDHSIRPCELEECLEQLEYMRKHSTKHLKDEEINGMRVSTVWLGIDHNYFGGRPLLFETMVFSDNKNYQERYCDRYSTWDEAIEGHKKAIQWVLDGCKDEMV